MQLPSYEVLLENEDYEVRQYQTINCVRCEYTVRPEGYDLLGGYTAGQNADGLPMPRTSPALMVPFASPKIMRFVLPHPHTPYESDMEPIPPPAPKWDYNGLTTEEITYCVAVAKFSGYATPETCEAYRQALFKRLGDDGITAAPDALENMVLAQYNEIFALPWNRDNEIWLEVVGESLPGPA